MGHVHLRCGNPLHTAVEIVADDDQPVHLCKVFAQLIASAIRNKSIMLKRPENANFDEDSKHAKRRAVIGRQPRGKKLQPVVSEFSQVIALDCDKLPPTKGSFKVLREVHGGGTAEDLSTPQNKQVMVGLFRTPKEFFDEACKATHPVATSSAIPDCILEAFASTLNSPPAMCVKHLLEECRNLTKLIHDFKAEDYSIFHKHGPATSCHYERQEAVLAAEISRMVWLPRHYYLR